MNEKNENDCGCEQTACCCNDAAAQPCKCAKACNCAPQCGCSDACDCAARK